MLSWTRAITHCSLDGKYYVYECRPSNLSYSLAPTHTCDCIFLIEMGPYVVCVLCRLLVVECSIVCVRVAPRHM